MDVTFPPLQYLPLADHAMGHFARPLPWVRKYRPCVSLPSLRVVRTPLTGSLDHFVWKPRPREDPSQADWRKTPWIRVSDRDHSVFTHACDQSFRVHRCFAPEKPAEVTASAFLSVESCAYGTATIAVSQPFLLLCAMFQFPGTTACQT